MESRQSQEMRDLRVRINTLVNPFKREIDALSHDLYRLGVDISHDELCDISRTLDKWHHDVTETLTKAEREIAEDETIAEIQNAEKREWGTGGP